MYRSVDAQGHVVFSDQAPAESPAVGAVVSIPVGDVEVRAGQAPPPLPDSEQPTCPQDGYLWTPGYWAWSPGGYYWVPGVWVPPPRVGVLWTPAYWVFEENVYIFHPGYWAPHIGYYGGVNYGFGYFGAGFVGGHWDGNHFAYNRNVSHVDEHLFRNTYSEPVPNSARLNRVSYNGGPGGITSVRSAEERAYAAESHIPATQLQRQNTLQAARAPVPLSHTYVKVNVSTPGTDHHPAAATPRPAVYNAPVVATTRNIPAPPPVSQPRPPRATTPPKAPAPAATHASTTTPVRATPTRSLAKPLH